MEHPRSLAHQMGAVAPKLDNEAEYNTVAHSYIFREMLWPGLLSENEAGLAPNIGRGILTRLMYQPFDG